MRFLLTCMIILVTIPALAGKDTEKELIAKIAATTDVNQKISLLGKLADYYYIYLAEKKGDSVLQQQLLLAEMASDRNRVLEILFSSAINNIPKYSSKETYNRTLAFVQKGIDYARETGNAEYEALGYMRKATLLSNKGAHDDAIQSLSLALTLLSDDQDSLRAAIYLDQGKNVLLKGDAVSACKHFNSAYDIAYSIKNTTLLTAAHHRYSEAYQFLRDEEHAKKSLLESLSINTTAGNKEGMLNDYVALTKLTQKKEYLEQAIQVAKSMNSLMHDLMTRRMMFYLIMVNDSSATKTLQYLKDNPDVDESLRNQGSIYTWAIASAYQYGNQPDSALRYYLQLEKEVGTSFEPFVTRSWHEEVAKCYAALKESGKAIFHFEKALTMGEEMGLDELNAKILQELSRLYAAQGQYEKAYFYNKQFLEYEQLAIKKQKDKQVTLLNVEREKKAHEHDVEELAKETLRTRNLQYIGITIATIAFFVFLFLIGMFPVSRTATRMLTFFAFVCLFEFIILLIDNWLHHAAHGEPLKIWLAKVGIIAILLPLHHYLDHIAYNFLSSHKLEKIRRQFSVKRIVNKIKLSEHKVVDTKATDPSAVQKEESHDTVA